MDKYCIVGTKLCTSTEWNFMIKTGREELPSVDIPERGEVRRYQIDKLTVAYASPHLPDIRRSVKPRIVEMLYGFDKVIVRQDHQVIVVRRSLYAALQRQGDFQLAIMGHIVRVLSIQSRAKCPGSTVKMIDNETGTILGTYSF